MNRRVIVFFNLLLTVFLLAGSLTNAQPPGKIPRIGYLGGASPAAIPERIDAFRQGLRELGYVEGKNIVIEFRWAEGKLDRLHALAVELVRLKVDVIVTAGPQVTRAAKEATTTIPIVMATDPILLPTVSSPAWRVLAGTSPAYPRFCRS